jgi:chromate transport protein ChrA
LLRLFYQTNVMVSTVAVPVWISLPALIITAGLAIWLLYENK